MMFCREGGSDDEQNGVARGREVRYRNSRSRRYKTYKIKANMLTKLDALALGSLGSSVSGARALLVSALARTFDGGVRQGVDVRSK